MLIQIMPVRSKNLIGIGYHFASSTLAVRFKSGSIFHHRGVPAREWTNLLAADDIGQQYHSQIKGRFQDCKRA